MTEHELMHFGILGQKWGVRRYQNEDGTLTAEGKSRLQRKLDTEIDKTKKNISKTKASVSEAKKIREDIIKNGIKSQYVVERQRDALASDLANLNNKYHTSKYKSGSATAADLMTESKKAIVTGEAYLKDLKKRSSYLNTVSVDQISDSGVGYKEAKKQIKNFGTVLMNSKIGYNSDYEENKYKYM